MSITSELIYERVVDEQKFANPIKNMILRLKPFFVALKHKKLVHNSLYIFKNCIPFLSKVGFDTEEVKNFSDEDAPNVVSADALSILAYKFYEDIIFILKSQDQSDPMQYDQPGFNATSNHISTLQLLREINKFRDEFLVTGHRFYEGKFSNLITHRHT